MSRREGPIPKEAGRQGTGVGKRREGKEEERWGSREVERKQRSEEKDRRERRAAGEGEEDPQAQRAERPARHSPLPR